jgi:hypothetical protein
MLSYHVALVSESKQLPFAQLAPVAAALSKQMIRDFGPMWRRSATVTAFPDQKSIPVGYYKMIVKDDIGQPGAAGFHTDDTHQPYALIQYDSGWAVTCSHELIEMIADPWGNRLYPGTINGKRVSILQELCDPCEAFTYTVDGITLSDFLTPEWYSPVGVTGKHYSFLGRLTAPHQVADGGYLSWLDTSDNHWYQLTNFGSVQISDLGVNGKLTAGFRSLREAVDFHSAMHHPALGKKKLVHESFVGPF